MSSQERQLVKASSTGTGSVSCHVVGLLPPVVYEALQLHSKNNTQDDSSADAVISISPQGRLALRSPRTPDGWSSLVLSSTHGRSNEKTHNMIYVWRQSTQTLSEPLVPASDKDVFQLQPPPHEESSTNTSFTNTGGSDAYSTTACSCLVAASGSSIFVVHTVTGLVCHYPVAGTLAREDKSHHRTQLLVPNVFTRLPLHHGERVTTLEACPGDSGSLSSAASASAWLVVGTSQARVFCGTRTARPLLLHVKEIPSKSSSLLGGIANAVLFRSSRAGTTQDDGVAGLMWLPVPHADHPPRHHPPHGGRTTTTTTHTVVPPTKSARIRKSTCESSFLTVTQTTLRVQQWTIVPSSPNQQHHSHPNAERHSTTSTIPGQRTLVDSLLPLLRRSSKLFPGGGAAAAAHGSTNITLLSSAMSPQGTCLALCLRVMEPSTQQLKLYVALFRVDLSASTTGQEETDTTSKEIISLLDVIWLGRYSHEVISTGLECAGLVVVEKSSKEHGNDEDGKNHSVVTCYAALGHPTTTPRVIISAVAIDMGGVGREMTMTPWSQDVDLPSTQVPAILSGMVSHDTATDGFVMMSTSGLVCVCSGRVDPPTSSIYDVPTYGSGGGGVVVVDASTVATLTNHLVSAFRQYCAHQHQQQEQQQAGTTSLPTSVSSTVPPSLYNASTAALRLAVVAAAKLWLDPHPDRSSSRTTGGVGAIQELQQGLQSLANYVNFLVHASLYKRLGVTERVALRDLGEQVSAICAGLHHWQQLVPSQSLHPSPYRIMTRSIQTLHHHCIHLPPQLQLLQQQWFPLTLDHNNESVGEETAWILHQFSSLLCVAMTSALSYREHQSELLYNIDSEGTGMSSSSWISDPTAQIVLIRQLQLMDSALQQTSSSSSSFVKDAPNNMTNNDTLKQHVETLSKVLLDSYRGGSHARETNEEAYHAAKALCVGLIRTHNQNNTLALQLSVDHAYFDGICSICHETKDVEALERLLQHEPSSLEGVLDFESGVTFSRFVLQWHADRGLYASVLDLGRHCSDNTNQTLTTYLHDDSRLADYKWIHSMRMGQHDLTTQELVSVARGQETDRTVSLDAHRLALSLAKLSSYIAPSPNNSNNNTVVSQQHTQNKQWIHNKLELVQAQELLTEGEDDGMDQDSVPSILSAPDIWQQAVLRLDDEDASRLSLEEKVKFCLVGLVAAQFSSDDKHDDDDKNAMCLPLAARVWAKSLVVDWDTTWSDLCDAPTFDRNELQTNHVASTTFYGLLQAYHGTSEEDPSVAFSTDTTMMDNVLEELGFMDSDGNLRDLLQVTAQLALASQ